MIGRFTKLSRKAFKIRRRVARERPETRAVLARRVEEARLSGRVWKFADIGAFLELAELWAPPTSIRAEITSDVAVYMLAVVSDDAPLERGRWYTNRVTVGGRPALAFIVAEDPPTLAAFSIGEEAGLSWVVERLKAVGALKEGST